MQAMAAIGIVGCGEISREYLTNLRHFPSVAPLLCFDAQRERGRATAEAFGLQTTDSLAELLWRPEIEYVLNLTPAAVHAQITLEALAAGKNVYSEKPLATDLVQGRRILESARQRRLAVGCAPDMILGQPLAVAREWIRNDEIGEIVSADALFTSDGPERWHENALGFYEEGVGPLADMGPYYLTALVWLLGSACAAQGMGRRLRTEREASVGRLAGARFPVRALTHVCGAVRFECGAVATITTSFDVPTARDHLIVYGTKGALRLRGLGRFERPLEILRPDAGKWEAVPVPTVNRPELRSIGLVEMIESRRSGRPHSASAELALHVVDIICALGESCSSGGLVEISTRASPRPLHVE
jgi:predicted dehydrogenase